MARNNELPSFDVALTQVTHHEGSTIFSYDCETDLTLEQLREPLNELMCALRDEVNRQEGIIGHIRLLWRIPAHPFPCPAPMTRFM